MSRRKANANKQHVFNFDDHTGRPAKISCSAHLRDILPSLSSLCLYFIYLDFP
ncbi:uncharacterized protein BKA55DRAFT_531375 [Fusarium redolens]|uniref:Uncharacterized protein n=1 Tax=Fusarium redolens TaxID=48865 RepID=A0A9P9JPI3_FUSRE|nr:uncharacterized protein BKA55DRAFT_531375 [Fusarium redolens]KAH7202867.1 hypothetical protein BKA55DRAFT_531375 [Fusarium redolens]